MNLHALCTHLNNSQRNPNQEVSILQNTIGQLLMNLGKIFPDHMGNFHGAIENMNQQIYQAYEKNYGVLSYFTGNGPIANQLKNYHAMNQLFHNEAKHCYSGQSNPIDQFVDTRVSKMIEQFDFKPITIQVVINEFNEFVNGIRSTLNSIIFTTTRPKLPAQLSFNVMETGIYGDCTYPEQLAIVLRTRLSNDLEVLYISLQENMADVWFYHPFEKIWLRHNGTLVFADIKPALEVALAEAIHEANPLDNSFEFEKELEQLDDWTNEVFHHEHHLPPRLYYAHQTVMDKAPMLSGSVASFVQRDEESFIIVEINPEISIQYRNTKGAYPSRSRTMVRKIDANTNSSGVGMAVLPSELSRPMQITAIQRTSQVLIVLANYINTHTGSKTVSVITNEG